MTLALFIARRLSLRTASGKTQSGIAIAVTGIALSVIVMLLSIAVMMGFKNEIRHKIMGFDSQITISLHAPSDGRDGSLINIDDLDKAFKVLPQNASATLTIRQPVILKTPDNFTGAVVKGMGRDHDWKFVSENLTAGTIPDYNADSTLYHTVISHNIAQKLNVGCGDKIDAYFLGGDTYRTRRLKIAGIYDTHFSEYDNAYIFATLPMLSALAGIDERLGTVVEINGLDSDTEISETAGKLSATLMDDIYTGRSDKFYSVTDIHSSAALYFNWLALLDTNVIVILTIMSLLTCLTLVSSLFILILRRVNMIGILKALGASDSLIRRAFVWLTMRLLILGLLIGNAIAIGIILLQTTTGFIPLDPEAYYLDHVPMEFNLAALLILNAGIILVSALVLILPSAIITTIPPSRVINYN